MNSNFIQQLSEYKIDNSELEKNSSHSDYVNANDNKNQNIDKTFVIIYGIGSIFLFIIFIPIFIFSFLALSIKQASETNDGEQVENPTTIDMLISTIIAYILFLLGLFAESTESNNQEAFITLLVLLITPFVYLLLGLYLNFVLKKQVKKNQKRKLDKEEYKEYLQLVFQVDKLNTTIDKIIALSKSKSAIHKLPPEETILEIIQLVREDLICALNLEKIKRNNPHLKGGDFVNFNSKDDYLEIINQINMQTEEINELLTNWQDTRTIIEDLINGND